MKHLRHPVRAIREPFGTAGLIIACLALVAALGGSALAASGALTGKQKKEVEKIAKSFAGKPGANGATGPQGAAGPAGKDGSNGANGIAGGPGESVAITSIAAGGECGAGVTGTKFSNATGSGHVCNGKNGQNGQSGFTETLPPEMTETGTWLAPEDAGTETYVPLSFAIPLEANSITEAEYVTDGQGAQPPHSGPCAGGTAAAPVAAPGSLCVYASSQNLEGVTPREALFTNMEAEVFGHPIGGPGAAMLLIGATGTRFGSFAVTAPAAP